jgi:hypothetical protein
MTTKEEVIDIIESADDDTSLFDAIAALVRGWDSKSNINFTKWERQILSLLGKRKRIYFVIHNFRGDELEIFFRKLSVTEDTNGFDHIYDFSISEYDEIKDIVTKHPCDRIMRYYSGASTLTAEKLSELILPDATNTIILICRGNPPASINKSTTSVYNIDKNELVKVKY